MKVSAVMSTLVAAGLVAAAPPGPPPPSVPGLVPSGTNLSSPPKITGTDSPPAKEDNLADSSGDLHRRGAPYDYQPKKPNDRGAPYDYQPKKSNDPADNDKRADIHHLGHGPVDLDHKYSSAFQHGGNGDDKRDESLNIGNPSNPDEPSGPAKRDESFNIGIPPPPKTGNDKREDTPASPGDGTPNNSKEDPVATPPQGDSPGKRDETLNIGNPSNPDEPSGPAKRGSD